MKKYFKRYIPLFLLTMMVTACSQDDTTDQTVSTAEQVDVSITLRTASHPAKTRATDDYLDPVGNNELINTYKVILAQGNTVVQVFDGDISASPVEQVELAISVATGTYDIYAFANVTTTQYDLSTITADGTLPTGFVDNTAVLKTTNGETGNIPMTGMMKEVSISQGENQDFAVEMVRAMAKIQFGFKNTTSQSIEVLGYEIEPLTADANGVYLFETVKDPKAPTVAIPIPGTNTTATYQKTLGSSVNMPNTNDEGTDYCYVNETNASINVSKNQYSVRFKIKRNGTIDEVRYGFTTQESTTTPYTGFNYIHRNDWIKIPVTFTDWQFRIEALPFVPIAGYPAVLLSGDALSATFSTGGYIIIQPFAKKYSDATWRDFNDPEVEYVNFSWTNADGTGVSGDDKIIKTALAYDIVNKRITGELNNALPDAYPAGDYVTTVTVNVKLGTAPNQFDYSFKFNIVLRKS